MKNEVLRKDTIQQELCKQEKKTKQMELDKMEEKNPYKTLLIKDIKKEE